MCFLTLAIPRGARAPKNQERKLFDGVVVALICKTMNETGIFTSQLQDQERDFNHLSVRFETKSKTMKIV